jgi:hypothetical protein
LYRELLDGSICPTEAASLLRDVYPDVPLSNGFHHGQVGAQWIARLRNAEGLGQ